MPELYSWIISDPETSTQTAEIISAHQATYDFYQELRYRDDWQRYVRRYREMASQHQRELESMRREPNLMRWFVRSRR